MCEPGCLEISTGVYKLNPKSNTWERITNLKSKRTCHKSFIVEGNVCFIGGHNDGLLLENIEVMPISKNLKNKTVAPPPMHNKRNNFGMCTFAGCVFVAGGLNEHHLRYASCEVYNTDSCKWTEIASMNTKKTSFPLVYFQDKVWAIGGFSNQNILDTIETYDVGENRWTTIDKKLLQNRCGHSAVVHGKKFYVIGGFSATDTLSSVEVYSSETNQFTFVTQMNQARGFFGCAFLNNKIYVIGGALHEDEFSDSVEVYDTENDVWSGGPSLPLALTFFGCTSNE